MDFIEFIGGLALLTAIVYLPLLMMVGTGDKKQR